MTLKLPGASVGSLTSTNLPSVEFTADLAVLTSLPCLSTTRTLLKEGSTARLNQSWTAAGAATAEPSAGRARSSTARAAAKPGQAASRDSVRNVPRSESPPAGLGHGVGEDAVAVGLDDLSDHGIGRCLQFAAFIVVLDFDFGVGRGLAVQFDDALEDVAGVEPVRAGERYDFGLEPEFVVPAALEAERNHDHFGVMDDEHFLGRFPERFGLDVEDEIARFPYGVIGLETVAFLPVASVNCWGLR